MQVDRVCLVVRSARFQQLELNYYNLVSNVAFKFKLRLYMTGFEAKQKKLLDNLEAEFEKVVHENQLARGRAWRTLLATSSSACEPLLVESNIVL